MSINVVVHIHAPHVIEICDMMQPKPDSYGRAGMPRAFEREQGSGSSIVQAQARSVPLSTQCWLVQTQIRKTSHLSLPFQVSV
jgi:hypothetical protein